MTNERHAKITRRAIRFTSLKAARSYVSGALVPMTVIQYDNPYYLAIHPQFADELVATGHYSYPNS